MNLGKSVHCRLLCAVLFPYHNERAAPPSVWKLMFPPTDATASSFFTASTLFPSRPPLLSPLSPWRGCEVVCTLGSDVCVYCRSRGHDRDRFTHPFHVGFLSIRSMS